MSEPKTFENGLYSLLENVSNQISTQHNVPALTENELRASANTLSEALSIHIKRHKRRATSPLYTKNLVINVIRTRNPNAEIFDEDGKKVSKGEKDWYYLDLGEVDIGEGKDVESLVEGNLRKEKSELLEAFREKVEMLVREWEDYLVKQAEAQKEVEAKKDVGKRKKK
jgi:hypothetical protein